MGDMYSYRYSSWIRWNIICNDSRFYKQIKKKVILGSSAKSCWGPAFLYILFFNIEIIIITILNKGEIIQCQKLKELL